MFVLQTGGEFKICGYLPSREFLIKDDLKEIFEIIADICKQAKVVFMGYLSTKFE